MRRTISRMLLAVVALGLSGGSPAGAIPSISACCACSNPAGGQAFFCDLVPTSQLDAFNHRCVGLGGEPTCATIPIDSSTCTFEGLACPAAPAPVLDLAALGALVGTLVVTGTILVRRRMPR